MSASIDELAKAAGLSFHQYDCLPQDFIDDVRAVTGVDVGGGRQAIVWEYRSSPMFGAPLALDPEALEILREYEARK